MNAIDKVSQITYTDVADYLRLTELTAGEITTLNNMIGIAKAYAANWTGRSQEELDDYQDLVIVILVLCQDMWDNRVLYVDKTNLNHVVSSILDMHSVNLL